MQIFLDLDGVVRDFDGAVFSHFGVEPCPVTHWDFLEEHICYLKGISQQDFWNSFDHNFWVKVPMLPWADEVLALMDRLEHLPVLLTAPTLNSAGGAQQWIRENLPQYFHKKHYLIGPAKWACAHHNTMLIDDCDANIAKFEMAGGQTILFPRSWNNLRCVTDPVSYLEYHLDKLGLLER